MLDTEESSPTEALWADFGIGKPAMGAPADTDLNQAGLPLDTSSVGGWDEPLGSEQLPEGLEVQSIINYLPQLMQRKYGKDWELLLAEAPGFHSEGVAGNDVCLL